MVEKCHFISNRDHETPESFLFYLLCIPSCAAYKEGLWMGKERERKQASSKPALLMCFETLFLFPEYSGKLT